MLYKIFPGDWIQAVSRKDKNKVKPKEIVKKGQKTKIAQGSTATVVEEQGEVSAKSRRIEDVIADMNQNKNKLNKALIESNTENETVPPPEVEEETSAPPSVESTPKKVVKEGKKKSKVAPAPAVAVEKVVEVKVPVPEPEPAVVAEAPVKATKGKKGAAPAPQSEFASNVAFDELGGGGKS
jgi:hypothetical protein